MRTDQDFAERKALAILDAWDRAPAPLDPKWRKLYAEAAIAAGLACYDINGNDLGAQGWHEWAAAGGGPIKSLTG